MRKLCCAVLCAHGIVQIGSCLSFMRKCTQVEG